MPAVDLFGTDAFPARLWIYTNFHCNLACGYCAVASSPTARRRSIGAEVFAERVAEAEAGGFREVFVTGGEPFLEPGIARMLALAAERLPTTVLTNAMLFRGRRLRDLERIAGLPCLTVQTSLDGARAETHDALRGVGSFEATLAGIRTLVELGVRVRVSTTLVNGGEVEAAALTGRLGDLGVPPEDHSVRPLVARGESVDGMVVGRATLVPELTVTADGLHWHPVGADLGTSPDLFLAPPNTSLEDARTMVVERVLGDRIEDGSLARPLACAIA
jgi:MoaA/NifB/PqqE/SkfB family radical SAM enzyme